MQTTLIILVLCMYAVLEIQRNTNIRSQNKLLLITIWTLLMYFYVTTVIGYIVEYRLIELSDFNILIIDLIFKLSQPFTMLIFLILIILEDMKHNKRQNEILLMRIYIWFVTFILSLVLSMILIYILDTYF